MNVNQNPSSVNVDPGDVNLFDAFIRDVTKVHPMAKSEARRRLNEVLAQVEVQDKVQEDNLAEDLFKILDRVITRSTPNVVSIYKAELLQELVPYVVERDHKVWDHAYNLGCDFTEKQK